jgi:hypothetical protein
MKNFAIIIPTITAERHLTELITKLCSIEERVISSCNNCSISYFAKGSFFSDELSGGIFQMGEMLSFRGTVLNMHVETFVESKRLVPCNKNLILLEAVSQPIRDVLNYIALDEMEYESCVVLDKKNQKEMKRLIAYEPDMLENALKKNML